jgi:hypothetical protein
MVEREHAYYIEEKLDEFDKIVFNFILSTQSIRSRIGCGLDPNEDKLIYETITQMDANRELD